MHLNSISNLLEIASLTINNTMKDKELQKKMASFGFPPKRMQEGKALLEQALMLDESKIRRYDERWELSYQIKTDLQSAREHFLDHVKVARLVFRHEPAMLHKLNV